jgi:signal peptidase I
MDFVKRAIAAIFDFLQGIVVVLAVMVMIYLFIMSPQEVNGQSMEPTFENAEYILTNKIEYKLTNPQRGDIVIFKSPADKEVDYIKRVIGLPGDDIRITDNSYYVNGVKLDETGYLASDVYVFGGSFLSENQDYIVPAGEYWVSGDNRPHSSDSREFGPIAKTDFVGKVIFRYWPVSRMGIIKRPKYNI